MQLFRLFEKPGSFSGFGSADRDALTLGTHPKPLKRGKKRKLLVKILLSATLLSAIYSAVDLKRVGHVLEKLHVSVAALLIGMYLVGQIISASKWRIFLRSAGIHRRYVDLLRAYFFGMFVNLFGIGTVGGDVARALAIQPGKGERVGSLASVIADRVHGLLTLATIGAFALLFSQLNLFAANTILLSVALLLCLAVGWFIGPKILMGIFPADSKLGKISQVIASAFPRNLRALIPVTILSMIVHVIQISMHLVMAKEFGVTVPYAYIFAVIPLVNIACSLPISFSGIGVREAMYVFFFSQIGVQAEVAVAFGAVWIVTATVVAIGGGLMYSPYLERVLSREDADADLASLLDGSAANADLSPEAAPKAAVG